MPSSNHPDFRQKSKKSLHELIESKRDDRFCRINDEIWLLWEDKSDKEKPKEKENKQLRMGNLEETERERKSLGSKAEFVLIYIVHTFSLSFQNSIRWLTGEYDDDIMMPTYLEKKE